MQLKFIICNMDLSFEKKIIIITRVLKVIMEAVFSLLVEENIIQIIIIGGDKKSINNDIDFYSNKGFKL
tara:strand:- start:6276 stop:6482 length:207 start_codon:yes stop_codon:yes gene_type:complete